MNKVSLLVLFAAVAPLLSLAASAGGDLKTWPEEEGKNIEQNYNALRQWQRSGALTRFGLPIEARHDLSGDGKPELFLLVGGHSYWGRYSVFTRRADRWAFAGSVRLGSHPPVVSRTRRNGWNDFSIETDGSRNRLERTDYRWEAATKNYEEQSTKEIRPRFPMHP